MRRPVVRLALIGALVVVGGTISASAAPVGPTSINTAAEVGYAPAQRQLSNIGGCPVFPLDNPWNTRVDTLPLRARSAQTIAKIQSIGSDNLHPDFGENPDY